MPYYALVIEDSDKAFAARRGLAVRSYQRAGFSDRRATAAAAALEPTAPVVGELWTVAATECPDELPNCRNCGDPVYADQCAAAGHCPLCGTAHGIAPSSVLEAHGLVLVELPAAPADDQQWNPDARGFVARDRPVD
jgi:hypothetical protein